MTEPPSLALTPAQTGILQKLLLAGFRFATMERITRHLIVERDGFAALLDPAAGKLRLYGEVGFRMGDDGIGMLTEQGGKKVFMWKKQLVAATPELLAAYSRVRRELAEILEEGATERA